MHTFFENGNKFSGRLKNLGEGGRGKECFMTRATASFLKFSTVKLIVKFSSRGSFPALLKHVLSPLGIIKLWSNRNIFRNYG